MGHYGGVLNGRLRSEGLVVGGAGWRSCGWLWGGCRILLGSGDGLMMTSLETLPRRCKLRGLCKWSPEFEGGEFFGRCGYEV